MKNLISLTAIALLTFIACEKAVETEQVCQKPEDTTLYSANLESLEIRRFEINRKIEVAKSLLTPIRTDSISRKLTVISASEPIHSPTYYFSKRDNPHE